MATYGDAESLAQIEQVLAQLPPEWAAEIRTWPVEWQARYSQAFLTGDKWVATQVVHQARRAIGTEDAAGNHIPPTPPVVKGPPAPDPTAAPPGVDQGMYSQAVDEAARSDPRSFVGYWLGQHGGDPNFNNPLSAAAGRWAGLFPTQRLLMNGYEGAPLYTFADALAQGTNNRMQPGAAGGGTGTAISYGMGRNALGNLMTRAATGKGYEYDALNGATVDDTANNIKTYTAAAYGDSLDPIYQKAAQDYVDRQKQNYYNQVYGQNDTSTSFLDWMSTHQQQGGY
jgi:hypothetical protein